ncbi:MAG: cytochrome C [Gammaproteobacteria bacterium]|nr:cytochrome C [Gammaproteobacteria bacterium]
MKKKSLFCIILLFVFYFSIGNSWGESQEISLREDDIEHSQENLQNGMQVVMNLCTLCHDLKYVRFRDLAGIGLSSESIDKIRGESDANDSILSKMNAEQMNALFGATTPDLSLMVKARNGGAQYIYSLLLGYHERGDGVIINSLFPDIKMPDVFAYSIEKDELDRLTLEQNARDVAAFLVWTADPKADERRTLGVYVMIYLFVLTFMLYLVKKKTWARLNSNDVT